VATARLTATPTAAAIITTMGTVRDGARHNRHDKGIEVPSIDAFVSSQPPLNLMVDLSRVVRRDRVSDTGRGGHGPSPLTFSTTPCRLTPERTPAGVTQVELARRLLGLRIGTASRLRWRHGLRGEVSAPIPHVSG